MQSGRTTVANVLRALRQCLGENDVMAYLAMMTVRLIECIELLSHRVLFIFIVIQQQAII